MEKLEGRVKQNETDILSAQHQLADHYEYAADLGTKVDELTERADGTDDTIDGLAHRLVVVEEDHQEAVSVWEDAIDCLRYGLLEIGGLVRLTSLTRDQRSHMMTQERGNFVLFQMRTQAETTDAENIQVPEQYRDDGEQAEEESPTEDEHVNPTAPETNLMNNLKMDQNLALAAERWSEASQIQCAIVLLLDATSGPEPEGLSMVVVQQIRAIFQRL